MHRLALYTFGVLKAPTRPADRPDATMLEFLRMVARIYGGMADQPGYLAHAMPRADLGEHSLFEHDWGDWGEFVVPHWYRKGRTRETAALAATLSLWSDVESAREFVYTGLHRQALNRRHDWFERTRYPGLVLWWVPEAATLTWGDGVSRLEFLVHNVPEPYAFDFHHPLAPDGTA